MKLPLQPRSPASSSYIDCIARHNRGGHLPSLTVNTDPCSIALLGLFCFDYRALSTIRVPWAAKLTPSLHLYRTYNRRAQRRKASARHTVPSRPEAVASPASPTSARATTAASW